MTGGVGTREGKERGQLLVDLLCAKSFTSSMSRSLPKNPLVESLLSHLQFTDEKTQIQRGSSSGQGHTARRQWSWDSSKPCHGPAVQRTANGLQAFLPSLLVHSQRELQASRGSPASMPSMAQIKTKLSEALKTLCSGLRPPPEPTSYHVLILRHRDLLRGPL